jgi:cell division protein DivIC
MKLLSRIPSWLRNKYFVAIAVFAAIMLFFDKNDIFTQMGRKKQLRELEESREYYSDQISSERKGLEQLKSNPRIVEKYVREKYLMKRDNEDLYLIQEKPVIGNN